MWERLKRFKHEEKGQALGFYVLLGITVVVAVFFMMNLGDYINYRITEQNALDAAVLAVANVQSDGLNGVACLNQVTLSVFLATAAAAIVGCILSLGSACSASFKAVQEASQIMKYITQAYLTLFLVPFPTYVGYKTYKKSGGHSSLPLILEYPITLVSPDQFSSSDQDPKYGSLKKLEIFGIYMGYVEDRSTGTSMSCKKWSIKPLFNKVYWDWSQRNNDNKRGNFNGLYDYTGAPLLNPVITGSPYAMGLSRTTYMPLFFNSLFKTSSSVICVSKARPYGGNVHGVSVSIGRSETYIEKFKVKCREVWFLHFPLAFGNPNFMAKLVPFDSNY